MCNENGGVIDDLIVYKIKENYYFIVVNASNREKDFSWMKEHQFPDANFEDLSDQVAQIALQGPRAHEILTKLVPEEKLPKKYYSAVMDGIVDDRACIISKTGYTCLLYTSMCGLHYPKDLKLDGINADGAFYGDSLPERSVYWQWNRDRPEKYCNSAVRRGDLKFIHPPVASYLELPQWEYDIDEDIKYHPEKYQAVIDRPIPDRVLPEVIQEELYDLSADRKEADNLVLKDPQQAEVMRHSLYAWFEDVDGDGHMRTVIKE